MTVDEGFVCVAKFTYHSELLTLGSHAPSQYMRGILHSLTIKILHPIATSIKNANWGLQEMLPKMT